MEAIKQYFETFIKLSDEEWNDFQQCLSKAKIPNKTFILEEGQICDYVAFIHSGMFRFYHLKNGEEKITAFSFAGDFTGNYRSFLSGLPSLHYVESMQESVIYKIHKSNLKELYDKHRNLERIGRLIAENLYMNVANRLDSFHFDTPKQRYEDLRNKNPKYLELIPQYMLASYLGIKPETLSRIRAKK